MISGRAAPKSILGATLVFHGFHSILIGFLYDFYGFPWISVDFCDFGRAAAKSILAAALVSFGFNTILLRFL